MQFDISAVPFSRYGSFMSFNVLPKVWNCPGLIFRTMHGTHTFREVFRVMPTSGGEEVASTMKAAPAVLELKAAGGTVQICFAAPNVVRFRARGLGLRLTSLDNRGDYAFPAGGNRWHVNCPVNRSQYLLAPLAGTLAMDAPHHVQTQDSRKKPQPPRLPRVIADFLPDETGVTEGTIEEFVSIPRCPALPKTFDDSVAAVECEWKAWKKTTPPVPKRYAGAAELAMYVNWASVVAPLGCFRRPTMLMSKNWMTQCWSWDHCFNAVALSYRNPDLAWDQWMTLFDHQDESGALPDSVSAAGTTWNFCKPPVHGWALAKMMRKRGLLTDARARQGYRALARWTDWWMARDYDEDGLPEYRHGNDSGWDNSTVFDGGFPVAAPDLAAYLVVQMDALSALADRLGRNRAAGRWKERANALRDRMIEILWNGEQFVSRRAFTGEVFPEGDSLINFLPIVMGRRLPKTIRDKVAAALEPGGRFVTDFGPATESPGSPLYVPDGYWRGPIWGPEVVIIVDGLARGGYRTQAAEIARRYCEMCRKGGFAENFNALTGEPLRDKAYTWASSAFLTLAHEFLRR